MQQHYRGHTIRLISGERWSAELIEQRSGALLPTTVSASAREGVDVCVARARDLIDLYLDAQRKLRLSVRSPVRLRLLEPIRR